MLLNDQLHPHTAEQAAKRLVIARDATPPTISWSITNLVLAADTNCSAAMPDVTGTDFMAATDLSSPLAVYQTPTNGAFLLIGTNVVVISVADAYGNAAYSTNTVVVRDQTPPQMLTQPQNQTNTAGTTADLFEHCHQRPRHELGRFGRRRHFPGRRERQHQWNLVDG